METQKDQAADIQQQLIELDNNIRQNHELLRRTQMEQKTTEVRHSQSKSGLIYQIYTLKMHRMQPSIPLLKI